MTDENKHSMVDRLLLAIILIGFGALILLHNIDVISSFNPWHYWPAILIVFGIRLLLKPSESRQTPCAIILILAGSILLANNQQIFEHFRIHLHDLWPLIFIFFGLKILFPSHKNRKGYCCHTNAPIGENINETQTGNEISISTAFSSSDYNYTNRNLKGGSVNIFMAGSKLNFRNAEIDGNEMTLNCSVFMGGIEIRIPEHWELIVKGTPVMGSIENKTRFNPESAVATAKRLIISGSVVMGSIEISN